MKDFNSKLLGGVAVALLAASAAFAEQVAVEGEGAAYTELAQSSAEERLERRSRRGRQRSSESDEQRRPPSDFVPTSLTEDDVTEDQDADTSSDSKTTPASTRPVANKPRRSTLRGTSRSRQADPNRANGLGRLSPPPSKATYRSEKVDDRWRLTQKLGITDYPWWDPYNQNTLKADRPVFGNWFFDLSLISETVLEPVRIPIPTGPQGEDGPGSLDVIGQGELTVAVQEFTTGFALYKGNTTFMPPDWEFRFVPVFNINRVTAEQARALYIDPRDGTTRNDNHVGIQELFVDKHLRDLSSRYDFDSIRIGIQPFNADFRGFLFLDEQLGIRYFGNRNNNKLLYNLAWFRRIEKDTNSGLNALDEPLRKDDIFVANMYFQDFPKLGFTSELIALYNRNTEGEEGSYFNRNGFIERPASIGLESPRNYDVLYLGVAGDGHLGRINLSATSYLAFGSADRGLFVDKETDIEAGFFAAEASIDSDWIRYRVSALYATGDDDPFDDKETGFDAVFEEPIFAGADTSYWIGQAIPFIGGGIVQLTTLDGVLNNLRSSKEEGQSNFTNPGTILLGLGVDMDLMPQLRVSANINQLWFDTSAVIEEARAQSDIDESIGTDISVAAIYRPFFTQNVIFRASAATLIPGGGYKALYGDEAGYSILLNLILAY
ncbi:MAG: hypothetical protein ACSHXK_13170 [Oceanococcus sp.]